MKKIFIGLVLVVVVAVLFGVFKAQNKQETITIKFSSWGSQSETTVLKDIIDDYEAQNKNIKIDFIHIPQNYFQKLQLLFASGLEPDIVFINNQNIKMYINAGLLEDLTPYLRNSQQDFFEEAIDCFKSNGKIYAIPRDISNLVIYYNKDILAKNNIKIEDLKTSTDLIKIGSKLKTQNIYAINSEDLPLYWLYFLAANGGSALSDDAKQITISNEKSTAALQFYSDLINKYHYAPTKAETGSMTTAQMFINKKIAMYLGGRWMVPKFRETIKFNWDVIEFPTTNENKLYIDASGWALTKKSKHKQEAADFINYLASETSSNKFAKSGLIIPAEKKSAELFISNEKKQLPKNSEAFINTIKKAKPTPVCENYGAVTDILQEKATAIFFANKHPNEAFNKKTIKKLEDLL